MPDAAPKARFRHKGGGSPKKRAKRAKAWIDTLAFSRQSLESPLSGASIFPLSIEECNAGAIADREGRFEGRPTRTWGKYRRTKAEMTNVRPISTLMLDAISAEVLKLLAEQRMVAMSTLISDILNGWLSAAFDPKHPLFASRLTASQRPASVPQRYPGYLQSLGFGVLGRAEVLADIIAPTHPVVPELVEELSDQDEAAVVPEVEDETASEVPAQESEEQPPEPYAPAAVVTSVPVRAQDPIPVPSGWGSSAQAFTLGQNTGVQGPIDALLDAQQREIARIREADAASRAAIGIPGGLPGGKADA